MKKHALMILVLIAASFVIAAIVQADSGTVPQVRSVRGESGSAKKGDVVITRTDLGLGTAATASTGAFLSSSWTPTWGQVSEKPAPVSALSGTNTGDQVASSVTFSAIPANAGTTVQQAIENATTTAHITSGTIANLTSLTLNTTVTPYQGIVSNVTLSAPTGNEAAYTFDYTTNKGSGDDTGVWIRQTDTQSPNNSYMLRMTVGGSDKFRFFNDGAFYPASVYLTGGLLATSSNDATLTIQSSRIFSSSGKTGLSIFSSGTFTQSSGNNIGISSLPTVSMSGTAAWTHLLLNQTETAVGSGAQKLIDAQVGSVSKFSVSNTGLVSAVSTSLPGGLNNRVVCWKGAAFGYCSTVVAADGSCTCN